MKMGLFQWAPLTVGPVRHFRLRLLGGITHIKVSNIAPADVPESIRVRTGGRQEAIPTNGVALPALWGKGVIMRPTGSEISLAGHRRGWGLLAGFGCLVCC